MTIDARAAERAADLLWTARTEQRTIAALPADCRPASVDDAWAIQRSLDAHAGAHAAGRSRRPAREVRRTSGPTGR